MTNFETMSEEALSDYWDAAKDSRNNFLLQKVKAEFKRRSEAADDYYKNGGKEQMLTKSMYWNGAGK
jgi:hypothetical protein